MYNNDNNNTKIDELAKNGEDAENIDFVNALDKLSIEDKLVNIQYSNTIKVPKKAEHNLRKYIGIKALKSIYPDIETAIELCLIYLSQLSNIFYLSDEALKQMKNNETEENIMKPLSSKKLQNIFTLDMEMYLRIQNLLLKGTAKGPFIETDGFYSINGNKSKLFKYGSAYTNKGIVKYELKTEIAINIKKNYTIKTIKKHDNLIINNCYKFYQNIKLPTVGELIIKGNELAKRLETKKGKIFTKGSRLKSKHKDKKNRIFIDDQIELFLRLTECGLTAPLAGSEDSGGRVVDSFTLMPSWIRKMVKYDGQILNELDYSALHPNLIVTIYKGKKHFINHQEIAQYLSIDYNKAKLLNLSFFNLNHRHFLQHKLYKYYNNVIPDTIKLVYEDKKIGVKTHQLLFKKEVELMSEVIKQCNEQNIYPCYVYDALYTNKPEIVKKIMNDVAFAMNIYTRAN